MAQGDGDEARGGGRIRRVVTRSIYSLSLRGGGVERYLSQNSPPSTGWHMQVDRVTGQMIDCA